MTRGLIIGVCELDPLEGNSMAGIPRKRGEGVWEAGVGAKVVRLPRKGTRKPRTRALKPRNRMRKSGQGDVWITKNTIVIPSTFGRCRGKPPIKPPIFSSHGRFVLLTSQQFSTNPLLLRTNSLPHETRTRIKQLVNGKGEKHRGKQREKQRKYIQREKRGKLTHRSDVIGFH